MTAHANKAEPLTEEDIACVAQQYLHSKGWATFPEVVIPIFGGRPDFAATKGNLCLVAEVKQSLSYPVIEQLVRWHLDYNEAKQSTYRNADILGIPHLMIAVVYGQQNIRGLKLDILKQYRIGVVSIHSEYSPKPVGSSRADLIHNGRKWSAIEEIAPQIQLGSRSSAHNIVKHLNPDMRCATAGSSGKVGGFMTPFKRTMGRSWQFINNQAEGNEVHINSIVEFLNLSGGHHYTNDKGAQNGILDALERDGITTKYCRFFVPGNEIKAAMLVKYPVTEVDVNSILKNQAQSSLFF